jgi:YHS domain-containing protein
MYSLTALLFAFFIAWAPQAKPIKCDANKTLRLDAVELVSGKQVPGRDDLAVMHHRFAYHFSSDANRAAFLANSQKYEIQMGGACGSMGPLSGDGSTSLWAVHDGRIYVFASEKCRQKFLKNPQRHIERDDPVPVTSEESLRRGRELLTRVVEAHGGATRIDAITTYSERLSRKVAAGNGAYGVVTTTTWRFPDGIREHECWDESCWSHTMSGDIGWTQSKDSVEPLHVQQTTALRRWKGRHLLCLLQARNEMNFVASSDQLRETIALPGGESVELEWLLIAHRGMNTKLGIETATGRVRVIRYHGRGLRSSLDDVQITFNDFHKVNGLTLARSFTLSINGVSQPDYSGTLDSQAVNRPQDRELFISPLGSAP